MTPGTFIFTLIRHINHVTIEKWRKKIKHTSKQETRVSFEEWR